MKFADFFAGQHLQLGPVPVEKQAVLDFATQWDPQWFHTDEAAAATGHFDGLIASGWHTCCMAMRIVADEILLGSESFASPGIEKLQWLLPVRPGDALTVHLFVRDVRRSRKRPELGVLHWDWQIDNQHRQAVLRMDVTSMFKLPVE